MPVVLVLCATTAVSATGTAAAPAARAASCPASGGAAVPRARAAGDVVFRGGGWGHGLGMSQYGAQGAARLGCSASQILTRYYTGTAVVAREMPTSVSVRMLDNGYRVDVSAETGDVTWDLAGCAPGARTHPGTTTPTTPPTPPGPADCPPAQPKGSTWQLRLDRAGARYVLWDLTTVPRSVVWQGGGPGQALTLRHSGSVVRLTTWKGSSIVLDRRLRWDYTRFSIAASRPGADRLDAVQVIESDATGPGMDKYLWGVAEVPASFPAEALRAQAIAARTYAAKRAGRVLMPTPADQNYTGYAKESAGTHAVWGARWRAAVDATSGQVLASTSTGRLVDALYCSSMGGQTEDERYVWGVDAPFLRPVDDSRWDLASSNPAQKRSWAKGFSWSALAGRLGFERITNLAVAARGTSARVEGMRVTGFRSGRLVTVHLRGWDVRQSLGLLSPGFEISVRRIGGAAATPIVGDWDGDGTDEPGWFRGGDVALLMRTGHRARGSWVERYRFGRPGDVPVVGDWDGDGRDSVGVFRAGSWLLRDAQSGGAADRSFRYGAKGDRPVVGVWQAPGKPPVPPVPPGRPATPGIGVVRAGTWMLRTTASAGAADISFRYGRAGDVPLVGDWDGNGVTSVGVRRSNRWLPRDDPAQGSVSRAFRYGAVTDRPVPGDWDGDGTTTAGVARGRTFYLSDGAGGGKGSRTLRFTG